MGSVIHKLTTCVWELRPGTRTFPLQAVFLNLWFQKWVSQHVQWPGSMLGHCLIKEKALCQRSFLTDTFSLDWRSHVNCVETNFSHSSQYFLWRERNAYITFPLSLRQVPQVKYVLSVSGAGFLILFNSQKPGVSTYFIYVHCILLNSSNLQQTL